MHGGTLTAYSQGKGAGSEFTLTLPLLEEKLESLPRESGRRPKTTERRRILIVDDNLDGATSLQLLLSMLGHETCVAHDGLQALRLAADFRPDTVLLDIGLPGLDGYEVARTLRADPLVIHRTRVDVLWGVADLMDAVTLEPATPGVPVLVLYGAHDEIVPPEPMCAWLETLPPAAGWQPALYPSGWHLLTRSRDSARVLDDLAAWFAQPGTGLPSGADTAEPIARVCALTGG